MATVSIPVVTLTSHYTVSMDWDFSDAIVDADEVEIGMSSVFVSTFNHTLVRVVVVAKGQPVLDALVNSLGQALSLVNDTLGNWGAVEE